MLLWQHTIPEILSQTMKLQSEANGQMMPLQIGYSNRHLPEKTFDKWRAKLTRPESCPQQERFSPPVIHLPPYPAVLYVEIVEMVSIHFLLKAALPFLHLKYHQSWVHLLFVLPFQEVPAEQDHPCIQLPNLFWSAPQPSYAPFSGENHGFGGESMPYLFAYFL